MTTEIFSKRYFRLPRAEIGHLRFILESYDGLAFARTLDSGSGLVAGQRHQARRRRCRRLLCLAKRCSRIYPRRWCR